MTDFSTAPQLDPREEHFWIPGPREKLSLFLRFLPAASGESQPRRVVLYVHGATFPSALSIAHRFDGKSWRDALTDAGFDVWGLDFYGFGHSGRYPEMDQPAGDSAPLCAARDAAKQLEAAVRFILGHQNVDRLSLISHSWGSMPAGLFASAHPALIDRLVLFAPIGRREPRRYETPAAFPAWRIVTVEDQWNRFIEDVPAHEPPVFSRCISTVIPIAAHAILPASRHPSVRSVKSSRRGTASSPTTRRRSNCRSQSSAANGMG
jgi:pimeloyl-ACP methyl ester carboxylesterase